MKGALKFVSEDQQMQILIIKSDELEIINPCFFKNDQNQINKKLSKEMMVLYEKIKGIRHLVNSVYNKLDIFIKKGGKYNEADIKKEAQDLISKFEK